MTIEIRESESCSDDHAVCADGAPLRSDFNRVVEGPSGFAIHDTQTTEGGALMFLVTRLPAVTSQDVTVRHATSAGTATSGVDYTDTIGTLTFAAGDTMKAVSVDTPTASTGSNAASPVPARPAARLTSASRRAASARRPARPRRRRSRARAASR